MENKDSHALGAQSWISVKDRLPEVKEWVLIFGHDYWLCKYDPDIAGSTSSFRDSRGYELWATHWMPLPEPPTKESSSPL